MPWLAPPTPFAKQPKAPRTGFPRPGTLPLGEVDQLEQGEGWLDVATVELGPSILDFSDRDSVEIIGSRLVGVRLLGGPQTRVTVRDSSLEQCDLSQVRVESALRSRFEACKLTGTEVTEALTDVSFFDCSLNMANMSATKLQRVVFADCAIRDLDLSSAVVTDVSFDSCTIEELNLDRTECERVDLREAASLHVHAGKNLRGCLVTVAQTQELAPWLAHQLGLWIEDESLE